MDFVPGSSGLRSKLEIKVHEGSPESQLKLTTMISARTKFRRGASGSSFIHSTEDAIYRGRQPSIAKIH